MVKINAYGKINLTLEVLGLREDGYHEIKSIMQSIGLHDELSFEKNISGEIFLEGNSKDLKYDDTNLIIKAAKLLKEEFKVSAGANIYLDKMIPIEAGLAGGSSDAGATLIGLNKLWNLGLSKRKLMKLGERIGSDVPFTILGGTALVEGRGEIVTKIKSPPLESILVVKPDFGVSTKNVYNEVDKVKVKSKGHHTSMMKEAIENDLDYKKYLYNDLEYVTKSLYEEVGNILEEFKKAGCKGLMSGSGPTCFCFGDNASIKKTYDNLSENYDKVYITTLFDWV